MISFIGWCYQVRSTICVVNEEIKILSWSKDARSLSWVIGLQFLCLDSTEGIKFLFLVSRSCQSETIGTAYIKIISKWILNIFKEIGNIPLHNVDKVVPSAFG